MVAFSRLDQRPGDLDPPGIEAVVVVLAADLPVPELEEDRDVRPQLGIGGKAIDGLGEQPAPKNFQRHVIAVHDRIQDVEFLGADGLLALPRGGEQCLEIAMGPDRREAIGELFLDYVLGKELRQRSTLGTILVDGRGMTLYTLTNNGNAVACTGPCATVWPPLTAAPGTTPVAPGVSSIGTTVTPTGSQLVTHNGLPLYRFSGDTTPGSTNGEGVDTFGGEWHVVKVAAGPTAAPGAVVGGNANASPKPSTGSYGY